MKHLLPWAVSPKDSTARAEKLPRTRAFLAKVFAPASAEAPLNQTDRLSERTIRIWRSERIGDVRILLAEAWTPTKTTLCKLNMRVQLHLDSSSLQKQGLRRPKHGKDFLELWVSELTNQALASCEVNEGLATRPAVLPSEHLAGNRLLARTLPDERGRFASLCIALRGTLPLATQLAV